MTGGGVMRALARHSVTRLRPDAGPGLSFLRLDADVTPGDGVTGVRLDADEAGHAPALDIRVVERCRLLALAGLGVREKHRVVIAKNGDLVLEPHARHERGTGRVLLHRRLIEVQVPDAVASLDFVDRARPVLELAVWLRPDGVEVLS